ncbi:ADP-ribosylation factor-like protein 13A isoform X3 [Harpia harpyja]|uniref:ADP-ribosylation factor-like protein 13A isoform X3 n=1 Tax=Harpia harpyja TaxID=202280 RepID=UPI0022B11E43|nr:ADP-ribosylation factor-like protein 13A isoform X3 [Harpia harpyja]
MGHPGVRCSPPWGESTGRRTKHGDTPGCSLRRCRREATPPHGAAEHVPPLLPLLVVAADCTGACQEGDPPRRGAGQRGKNLRHYGHRESDLARIEEARKVLSRVLSHPDVSGKPLLLLANKQDSATALLPCELIERLSLERLVNENRSPCRIEPCAANRAPPAGPGRATLQGLRWLLRTVPAAPVPPPAPAPRAARGRPPARRDPPPAGEDARDGTGKTGEYRPLRPGRRLLPVEESAKAPGRRKRKGKVRKKGSGQPSPAEEPEGPGGGGDSRAGAAGGLLPPNRVVQREPAPTGMATPHPVQGTKKKKKKKIKNKIKSQEPAVEPQCEEVSSTFDLYRRAMLALKVRQEQRKQQSAIVP